MAKNEKAFNDLSTSAFFQQPTSPQVDKTTKPQVDKTTSGQTEKLAKPQVEKYTTHLRPATIRAVKRYAVEHEMKDYEVMQLALDAYLGTDEQVINGKRGMARIPDFEGHLRPSLGLGRPGAPIGRGEDRAT